MFKGDCKVAVLTDSVGSIISEISLVWREDLLIRCVRGWLWTAASDSWAAWTPIWDVTLTNDQTDLSAPASFVFQLKTCYFHGIWCCLPVEGVWSRSEMDCYLPSSNAVLYLCGKRGMMQHWRGWMSHTVHWRWQDESLNPASIPLALPWSRLLRDKL